MTPQSSQFIKYVLYLRIHKFAYICYKAEPEVL
jgi:hypothetical protein